MADINWSLTGTESLVIRNGSGSGSIANINDNNASTSHAVGVGVPPGAPGGIDFDHIVTFTETVLTINKAEIVCEAIAVGGGITSAKLYLFYSGGYNEVLNIGTGIWTKATFNTSGTWNNVTKIKLTCTGTCFSPVSPTSVALYDFELRAWGPPNFVDIGLRIKASSSIIKIGTQPLDGHKLRIRKGGTTYGIPLLTPGDSQDSGLRIYDGSAVKALPFVD